MSVRKGGAKRGALARKRVQARLAGEEVPMEYGPREEGRGYPKVVRQYAIPKTMLGPRLQRAPPSVKEAVAEAYKEPITFVAEPPAPPKGIAQTIVEGYEGAREAICQFWAGVMGWSEEERVKYKEGKYIRAYSPTGQFAVKSPLYVAGAIASVEAPVYSGERLVSAFITHHEPITPTPPPAFIGGIIGEGIGVVTGVPSYELEMVKEYGPEYAMGTIFGDIMFGVIGGKAIGWGTGKAWGGSQMGWSES